MNSPSSKEFALPDALRASYYAAGYWRSEDLWTSFEAIAAKHSHATAFIEGDRSITFGELATQAERFGRAARARGLQDGDVLIVHGRHSIEAVVAILGCAYAKLVVALLPHMFSVEQIQGVIDSTNAKAIVGVGEPVEIDRTRAAAAAMRLATIVVPDGMTGTGLESELAWSKFLSYGDQASTPRTAMSADDLILLIFSSGTTGAPKGVMHSSNTARFAAETYGRTQGIGPADVNLVVTAFGFVGSSVLGVYLSFLCGCRTVLLRNWSVEEALALIERRRVTHFLLMPTHAIDILSSPKLDQTDCSSVSRGVVAGVSEAHRLDARRRLCARPVPMYGMSESPGHVTGLMEDDWENLRTTEGRCLPGAEILICDADDQPVPVGEQGAILVRGPNRFLGYHGAVEPNRASLTAQGYFRTGDLGVMDADGYLTFVGRSKDIIRRGGLTILPSDVEAALRAHPRISDVAVIGLPDPRLGERACACVITRDRQDISLAEITQFLERTAFPRYMWPEHVALCESFPRTPSLKVQKNELRKHVLEQQPDT
ncbi:MAG: class I adenylate-forming enzyme family protein [Steroidobacteraceae bacterium]|nr:class I adenylate-forming enzyme family protein [Steroidobacteraceae bacterium]